MYLYYWFVFQSIFYLSVVSNKCDDDYIYFHNIYGIDSQAYIRDAQVPLISLIDPEDYAILTCPRDIAFIAESSLPDAGLGVFAARRISEGTYFGPYGGHKSNTMMDSGAYAWTVFNDLGKFMYYVDGFDTRISNWLRYINCPNFAFEQNLVPIQYDGNIFYQAIRDIEAGEELLVYYGDGYATYLGINRTQSFEYAEVVQKPTIT